MNRSHRTLRETLNGVDCSRHSVIEIASRLSVASRGHQIPESNPCFDAPRKIEVVA